MKAAVRSVYGPPKVLSIKEIDIPIPADDEVLVKVYAATVNRTDCGILWGKPYIVRMFTGLFKPRLAVTGSDFAGQVEATGKNVISFKPGDKVMGFGGIIGCGSHAQYLAIPETKAVLLMPSNMNYEEAVACLEGAFYAFCTIKKTNPRTGQKALVNGATGAIGSSMVQLLKFYGAYVTAVCNTGNVALVRSLGADKVIDYTSEDFTKDNEKYDFVFDAVSKSSFFKCKPLLNKNGIYTSGDGMFNLVLALFTPLFGGKKVVFAFPKKIKEGLAFIKGLAEKGNFKAVIDRTYPIEQIAPAFEYVANGKKTGNVIIKMEA